MLKPTNWDETKTLAAQGAQAGLSTVAKIDLAAGPPQKWGAYRPNRLRELFATECLG